MEGRAVEGRRVCQASEDPPAHDHASAQGPQPAGAWGGRDRRSESRCRSDPCQSTRIGLQTVGGVCTVPLDV